MTSANVASPWVAGARNLDKSVGDLELSRLPLHLDATDGVLATRFLLRLHGEACGRLTISSQAGRREVRGAVERAVMAGECDDVLHLVVRRAVSLGVAMGDARTIEAVWSHGVVAGLTPRTTLTVAICTRDRPDGVAQVVASLHGAQPDDGVEVLVVDNAPTDDRTRVIAQNCGDTRVRYLVEASPGLDHARNAALRHATGDVVAFADDDVIVDAAWGTRIRQRFDNNPDLTLLTGLVEPASLETEAERWFERYGGFGRGYLPQWIAEPNAQQRSIAFAHANTGRYGTGANLAVRRKAALHLGGFDPSLDVGTATCGGGDLEMMFRVLKGGGVIGYAPDVVVRHRHRLTWDELASQIESWGSGMVAHLTRTARAHRDERLAVQALRAWLYGTWFAKRLAFSYFHEPFPRELITRELRGSFRGVALYAESSRAYPPPPPTPALFSPARTATGTTSRTVTLGAATAPIDADGRVLVRLSVEVAGRTLGALTIAAVGGVVGATRARDAIARELGHAVVGRDIRALRKALWAQIARGAQP